MPSARSVLKVPATPKPKREKPLKRKGNFTKPEKALVAQVVMDQPGEMTRGQVLSLSRVLRRTPEAIRNLIAEARENFVEAAGDYVAIHREATKEALISRDFETALKGSQWAMTNMSAEGQRIVDKPTGEVAGTKIMIGIQMGGMTAAAKVEGA